LQNREKKIVIEFDLRRQPPTGSRPELPGIAQQVWDMANAAASGVYDELVKIDGHPHLNQPGKKAAATTLGIERAEVFKKAEDILKAETAEVEAEEGKLREKAGITKPGEPNRDAMIIGAYQGTDRSGRNLVIRKADPETARALLNGPRMLNLLSDSQKRISRKPAA
jgi:hypothetical protein